MKTKCLVVLMFLTFLVPAFAQGDASNADAEQAIARLREGLVKSFNDGDIDRLLTFLDTNAVVRIFDVALGCMCTLPLSALTIIGWFMLSPTFVPTVPEELELWA